MRLACINSGWRYAVEQATFSSLDLRTRGQLSLRDDLRMFRLYVVSKRRTHLKHIGITVDYEIGDTRPTWNFIGLGHLFSILNRWVVLPADASIRIGIFRRLSLELSVKWPPMFDTAFTQNEPEILDESLEFLRRLPACEHVVALSMARLSEAERRLSERDQYMHGGNVEHMVILGSRMPNLRTLSFCMDMVSGESWSELVTANWHRRVESNV